MKKDDKNLNAAPQALDDDFLGTVAGGRVTINANGTYTLYGDGRGENQGTYSNVDDLRAMAKRLGTSTKVTQDNRGQVGQYL